MPYKLNVSNVAESHIDEAAGWYYLQAGSLESKFLVAVGETLQKILENPLIYPNVNSKYRRALIRNFSYIIYFAIDRNTIKISAVFHTSRCPETTYKQLH